MRNRHSKPLSVSDGAPARRRGVLSLELVLTLPILMVLLFGLFEFSLLFSARGSVVEASRQGARHATVAGADQESVEAVVAQSLGTRMAGQADVSVLMGERTGDPVIVAVRVPMAAASPDLLWPIGFGLAGRDLYCETQMVKE